MKHYQVDSSAEPSIIGVNNGIYQVEIDKRAITENTGFKEFLDFFNSQNINFWNSQDKIESFKIPKMHAKLLKKAKTTDIMGYTPNISFLNKIYSAKYIDILKSFKIDGMAIFEVDITDVTEKYFMLFIKTILLEEVNYEKSLIYTGHRLRNNLKYHEISNRAEYGDFLQQNPLGGFEKISIPKKYENNHVIKTQASPKLFYSEKLIDFLLDCGITGLVIGYNNSIELDFY